MVYFIKKPVIQNTTASLSGYGKIFDGNVSSYGVFAELSNSFGILEKPDLRLGLTGNFSWEDLKGSSSDYWLPVDSLKGGGTLTAVINLDFTRERSLSDNLMLYGGYYSDGSGKGGEFSLSNTVQYSNKDFTGYFQLSGSIKGQFDYWSITVEFGADAGLPDLLSL